MKALAFLIAAVGSVHAAEPGLVVMDFQSRGILDKAVLRQLWDRTWEIASQYPSVNVLSIQETRQRIFDQNVLVPAGCTEICFKRIALKLQAKELLIPSVEKTNEQLKFGFVRIDGESGKRLKDVSVWSDGRVDRAIASGVLGAMGGASNAVSGGIPSAFWKSLSFAGLGIGTGVFLGLTSDRTLDPIKVAKTTAPPKPPINDQTAK